MALPILNTEALHTEHLPRVAGRPFLSVTCSGLLTSREARHFRQYASTDIPPITLSGCPQIRPLRSAALAFSAQRSVNTLPIMNREKVYQQVSFLNIVQFLVNYASEQNFGGALKGANIPAFVTIGDIGFYALMPAPAASKNTLMGRSAIAFNRRFPLIKG